MAEATKSPALPELATDSIAAFERYLDRKPLNDELAEIRAGNLSDPELPHPAEIADKDTPESTERLRAWKDARPGLLDWTPTRKQVAALADTIASDGWQVFLDLMKKRLENLRETAITVSQNDPLRNKDTVAEEWAYHGLYRKVLGEMEPIVREQLDRLKAVE
jgi:hypothetical protein